MRLVIGLISALALILPARAQAPKSPTAKIVLRVPAAIEGEPDAGRSNDRDNDVFRRNLMKPEVSDRWLVPTQFGGILMIVEKNFLSDERLDQLAADLQEAVSKVPEVTDRPPLIRKRFTVYVYDDGPVSKSGVPGATHNEDGLMLMWINENREPVFHEMTHLLAGRGDSQSLNEGIAMWVQEKLRPGRACAFVRAGTNPDAAAKAALAENSASFRANIGAPGFNYTTPGPERFDFYLSSWSFMNFLMRQGNMKAVWILVDAGGTPESYAQAYGRSRSELVEQWAAELSLLTPPKS